MSSSPEGERYSTPDIFIDKEKIYSESPMLAAFLDTEKNVLDWESDLELNAEPYAQDFNKKHTYRWQWIAETITSSARMTRLFHADYASVEGLDKVQRFTGQLLMAGYELHRRENISAFLEEITERFLSTPYANPNLGENQRLLSELYIANCLFMGAKLHSGPANEDKEFSQPKEDVVFKKAEPPQGFEHALDDIDWTDFPEPPEK